jgi:hypothetical protein
MELQLTRGATAGALVVALGLAACTGSSESPPAAAALPVDRALFEQTWPMRMVAEDARRPYEGDAYVQAILNRDYGLAIKTSGAGGGLPTARFHADAAAMYRQAALATANAYVQYFEPPLGQAYDPVEASHLVVVGRSIRGELDGARAKVEAVRALPSDNPVVPWSAPWLAWLDAGAVWPPDLSAMPHEFPPVAAGGWPEVTTRPSYTVAEQEPGTNQLAIDDPGLLVRLALWHDEAARLAAPDHADVIAVYGARYRLPVEPKVTAEAALPIEFLFGSDYLTEQDASFLAAVHGPAGLGAVDTFKERSFTAAVVAASRSENGKIDSVKAVDLVNDIRKALKEEQAIAAGALVGGGAREEFHHPIFADVAVAGLYRNLAYIAELEGDRETSGKLRIAARDVERDAAAAPEGLLSLAAWDADNQYTIRGSEIIHQTSRRAPSLEVARTAFDLIGIRVSRSRGGGTPGM